MKRSEMVDIIMNELSEHINYETLPIIVASELLAKLEVEGMLPPLNKHSFYTDGENADENLIRHGFHKGQFDFVGPHGLVTFKRKPI